MRIDKYHFCPDDFWDNNLTWFTNKPRFTRCFENTAILFPTSLLILFGVPWVFWISYAPKRFLKKKDTSISWHYLSKLIFNILAIIATVLKFCMDTFEWQTLSWSDVLNYSLCLFNLTFAISWWRLWTMLSRSLRLSASAS